MIANYTTTVILFMLISERLFSLVNEKARRHISSLHGKHVVITGGSSGIGFALAKECLSQGAFVTLMARTPSRLSMASQLLGHLHQNGILLKAVDVSDATAVRAAIVESFEWRPIDILVCNAGVTISGLFDRVKVEELDMVTRTNLLGCVYPVHAALPLMKARSMQHPTAIVLMSSLSGLVFVSGTNMYTPTKYALRGLAELLRFELMPYNIKVSLVCPGFTETPMLNEADKAATLNTITFYDRAHAESADEVAAKTMEGVKRGEFLITTSMHGFLIGVLGRGYVPAESLAQALIELFLLVPARLSSLAWMAYAKSVIRRKQQFDTQKVNKRK